MLADYDFYRETYHGKMSQEDFERLIFRASIYVRRLTFGRDEAVVNPRLETMVHMAQCAVADAMELNERGGGTIAETNDGVSVTYAVSKSTVTEAQRLYQAAALYLSSTGLMFQGATIC